MDSLVFKKFDLIKRSFLKASEGEINKLKHALAAKGMLQSGVYLKGASDILVKYADKNIDTLLQTYIDVGRDVGEELVVEKEKEVVQEVERLAGEQGQYIHDQLSKIAGNLKVQLTGEYSSIWTNILSDSRQKAEMLIDTHKRRLKNLKPEKALTDEVFVVMQIGNDQMDGIWKNVYVPVIDDCNLKPRRIDKHNEGRFLMSEISDLIQRSRLIIADLTNARPNCYLEVGYALGIEKRSHLILTANENHNPESSKYVKGEPKVHFDISGYDILFWNPEDIEKFKVDLAKKIKYRLTVSDG